MKTLIILILCSFLFSCSNGDSQISNSLLRRIDSLENHITTLSHEKDSLAKIAIRWEYGRDYSLYANDFEGGNSISWRCARSVDRLKFDESLFDSFSVEKSNDISYDWRDLEASEVDLKTFYVNTNFEADRYNYYLSVLYANAMNEAVYSVAADLAKTDPNWSRASIDCVISVYAGLIYKQLYNHGASYDKTIESVSEACKSALISNYKSRHNGDGLQYR